MRVCVCMLVCKINEVLSPHYDLKIFFTRSPTEKVCLFNEILLENEKKKTLFDLIIIRSYVAIKRKFQSDLITTSNYCRQKTVVLAFVRSIFASSEERQNGALVEIRPAMFIKWRITFGDVVYKFFSKKKSFFISIDETTI